jgi:hypothetical protein
VAVAVRLKDIRTPNGKHAIEQHPARRGVHDALSHRRGMTGTADNQVAARVQEETGPFLQTILIDQRSIVCDQILDTDAYSEVIHDHSPINAR